MTYAQRLEYWNRLYDEAPEGIRLNVVLWGVAIVGAVNMLLTVTIYFPFALLILFAIIAIAAIRVPHALGWVRYAEGDAPHQEARMEIEGCDALIRWNEWFDAMPYQRQWAWLLGTLLPIGFINMALSICAGFPFGLLMLFALLAGIVLRGPYVWGWLKPGPAV